MGTTKIKNGGKEKVSINTEKRKYERVETHIPVRFCKLRDGAGIVGRGSITKNLSQGGVRFRTTEFVPMACRLIVEMDIPLANKTIKAISKVAWIRKTTSGDEYELGNRFLEMSQTDKTLVSEYVDGLKNLNDPEIVVNSSGTA